MNVIIEQEIALHQYENRKNKALVEQLLHPEFKEVGESGTTYDFQDIIALLQGESDDLGYIHSQDYECLSLAPSVKLLLYKTAWNNGLGEYSQFTKRSSIWVLVGENWLMKYHQGTPCEEFQLEKRTYQSH